MKPTAWLFPGPGSQYTGMGHGFAFEHEKIANIFLVAEALSEQPLRQISKNGSAEQLRQPIVLEPLLTAFAISYVYLLQENNCRPSAAAGYSAGILPALYCVDSIGLEDTIKISVARGKLLTDLSLECQGQIITLSGLDKKSLVSFLASSPHSAALEVAGWNTDNCISIVGPVDAISHVALFANQKNIKATQVATAGAWHSHSAAGKYHQFLESFSSITFSKPKIPFYSSVTGCKESCTQKIAMQLASQVHMPVMWQAALANMEANESIQDYLEVGCGMSLKTMHRPANKTSLKSPTFKNIYAYIGATYA
jgi:[acyl-carrier-protein] S-malonyltransferase